jgi:hypothetical protein
MHECAHTPFIINMWTKYSDNSKYMVTEKLAKTPTFFQCISNSQ